MRKTEVIHEVSVKPKKGKKKGNASKSFGGSTSRSFGKSIGFPDRLSVILAYSDTISFSGSASPSAQVYSANSAFDPNFTGVGHQPTFYDVLQQVYGRYIVKRFKVEVEWSNTTATMPVVACTSLSDQNNSSQTVEQLSEGKYAKFTELAVLSGGPASKRQVFPWMDVRKIMGTPNIESDDNMYAAVSASPADLAFVILKCCSIDITTTIVVYAKVRLLLAITFKDLVTTYPSLKAPLFLKAEEKRSEKQMIEPESQAIVDTPEKELADEFKQFVLMRKASSGAFAPLQPKK